MTKTPGFQNGDDNNPLQPFGKMASIGSRPLIYWFTKKKMGGFSIVCLVSGWATPLKNMKVSWGYYSQ